MKELWFYFLGATSNKYFLCCRAYFFLPVEPEFCLLTALLISRHNRKVPMNPSKYKSVAIKIDTYEKLKYISKNTFDVDVSMSSMCANLIESRYQDISSPNYCKPLKGNAKYQIWKRKIMNQLGFTTTSNNEVSSETLNKV